MGIRRQSLLHARQTALPRSHPRTPRRVPRCRTPRTAQWQPPPPPPWPPLQRHAHPCTHCHAPSIPHCHRTLPSRPSPLSRSHSRTGSPLATVAPHRAHTAAPRTHAPCPSHARNGTPLCLRSHDRSCPDRSPDSSVQGRPWLVSPCVGTSIDARSTLRPAAAARDEAPPKRLA